MSVVSTQAPPESFEPPEESVGFYTDIVRLLAQGDIPYLISGTFALTCLTGVSRPTKDLDVFCKAGDAPRLLARFRDAGYRIGVEDDRWIGKVYDGDHFVDVIYNLATVSVPVTDSWFEDLYEAEVYGTNVRILAPTEFILSKIFLQDRYRYDGADVAHMILRRRDEIDWQRLLSAMELHWEVLLTAVLNFRYIYPTERNCVPRWLFDLLIERVRAQADLPQAEVKVCRGRVFSPRDYITDITEWGFADLIGRGLDERPPRHG
ncbi:MAG: nucleotidyltransferase family protein [Porphyrobacter sp.]|nr:nucleotidyltransferase family protein [Porphyrobacter sp.]